MVKKPGPGEQGAASQVCEQCWVLHSVPFGYKLCRNVASEGVNLADGRQEEQSVPSVSTYLSQFGFGLPPPL